MKIVFAGPSLYRYEPPSDSGIKFCPPAFHGDIYDAVQAGANVIGIIDGFFESVSSIWHKEILFAMAQGVQVFGAASMGALRAAECAEFGMVGVGEIFEAYRDGTLIDDEAVAVCHAPQELGYMPITVPFVNVMWSLAFWHGSGLVTTAEMDRLLSTAGATFFKDRTWRYVVDAAGFTSARNAEIIALARSSTVDRKALDAQLAVEAINSSCNERLPMPSWTFSFTPQFRRFLTKGEQNELAM